MTIAERRIQADRNAGRGIRPLRLQMLGRRDDHDPIHHTATQELTREAKGERGLAGAGGCGGEEVARPRADAVRTLEAEVAVQSLGLPRTKSLGMTPRRPLRIRR